MVSMNEEIQYDSQGVMMFHPDFHDRHGTPFTLEDMIYLCKYYEFDHIHDLSFALGRTPKTLREKVRALKKSGEYEIYKVMN